MRRRRPQPHRSASVRRLRNWPPRDLTCPDPSMSAPREPSGRSEGWWPQAVFILLVLISSIFTMKSLLPELSLPIPSLNDDAFHYLFIQRAGEALAQGENPFDH